MELDWRIEGIEGEFGIDKNQIMADEIAGYFVYCHEEALSQGRKVAFFLGENTIGRDQNNRVVIPEITISKLHARLIVTPTDMTYYDLSKNGTKINSNSDSSKMKQNTPIRIFAGNTLYLGDIACKVERNQLKFPEETATLARPLDQKKRDNIMSILCDSDSQQDTKLEPKNNELTKPNIARPPIDEKPEIDEFSLTGDFYQADKKGPSKAKKDKDTKKIAKGKEDKKEKAEEGKKQEEAAKNKKEKAVAQPNQEEGKSKEKKMEQKFIMKEAKEEKEKAQLARVSREKQQQKARQLERAEKAKKEKEEEKKKEKQERRKKQKQEQEKKEKEELEKKRRQEVQIAKSLEHQKSKQPKRTSKEKESNEELNNSRRNIRKTNPSEGQDTKRRISRKRLPSSVLIEGGDYYPLRSSFANKRVLISGFVPDLTRKYFCIVENIEDEFDYLVMKEYKRTFKALYAICKGILILRFQWIRDSEFLEKVLKPEPYIFKEMPFIYHSIDKVNTGLRVFKGFQFYLGSEEYHLKGDEIEALVYAGGGEVMKKMGKLSSKDKESKNKIAIVRNLEEKTHKLYEQEVKRVRKLGFEQIHTIQMILDSCQKQQIDWQKSKVK